MGILWDFFRNVLAFVFEFFWEFLRTIFGSLSEFFYKFCKNIEQKKAMCVCRLALPEPTCLRMIFDSDYFWNK